MADPAPLIAALRAIHVLAAMLWLGGAVFFLGVVRPLVRDVPAVGGPFMLRLAARGSIAAYFGLTSGVTTLFGLVTFWRIEAQDAYPTDTLGGVLFMVGVAAGLIAFLSGLIFQVPTANRMKALAREVAAAQGPPPQDRLAALQVLANRMVRDGWISVALLSVAATGMVAGGNLLAI